MSACTTGREECSAVLSLRMSSRLSFKMLMWMRVCHCLHAHGKTHGKRNWRKKAGVKFGACSTHCSALNLLCVPVLVSHVCNRSLPASKRVRHSIENERVSVKEQDVHCLVTYLLACWTRVLRSSTQLFPTEDQRATQGWPMGIRFPTTFVNVMCTLKGNESSLSVLRDS